MMGLFKRWFGKKEEMAASIEGKGYIARCIVCRKPLRESEAGSSIHGEFKNFLSGWMGEAWLVFCDKCTVTLYENGSIPLKDIIVEWEESQRTRDQELNMFR